MRYLGIIIQKCTTYRSRCVYTMPRKSSHSNWSDREVMLFNQLRQYSREYRRVRLFSEVFGALSDLNLSFLLCCPKNFSERLVACSLVINYTSLRARTYMYMWTWTYCLHVPILVPIFSVHAWFGRNSCFERIV